MSNETSLEKFGYEESLKRVLPLSFLVFYGFAYICPTSLFGTYAFVANLTHGMISLAYLLALVAMLFTAYSYVCMSKAYPIAGSAYSYTQRSINPYIGFLSGWAIILAYMLIPMINYLLASIFLAPYLPNIPSWVIILIMISIVTIVNHFGITATAWTNNILILFQMIFYIAFMLFIIKWLLEGNGAGTLFSLDGFYNAIEFHKPDVGWRALFTGASILALNFLGFDAVTTVAEEAVNPEKNIGRAIVITAIGAGVFFILGCYLMTLAWPNGWNEFKVIGSGAQELIVKIGGAMMGYLFTATYVTATLASAMASQASASRILFGMGRDGVLPKKFFGYVHPKYKTPTWNILMIGFISLSGIFLSFAVACGLINFGALLGFTMVNISVVAHYFIRGKKRDTLSFFRYLIVPIIGAIVCLTIWWSLSVTAKLLGFAWLAIGTLYLASTTNFFRKLPPELDLKE